MMLDHYHDRETAGQIMELQPAGRAPLNAVERHNAKMAVSGGFWRGATIGSALAILLWAAIILVLVGCAPRDAAEAERFARYRAAANASLQTSLGTISDNRPVVCQRYGNTAVCQ